MNNEITNTLLYVSEEGAVTIEVIIDSENETMWANQKTMAELFNVDRSVITKHLKNIYEDGELNKISTCAKIAQVQVEGKRSVKRIVPLFNLDMIISVGYRVNSKRGVKFRQWANRVLKEYLIKGYAVDQRIHRAQIGELRQLVGMLGRTIQSQPLKTAFFY